MADEDDVELEIRARLNEQSAVDAATDLANVTARTIDRKLGNRIAGTINKSLEKVGQGGALGKVLDPLNKAAKDAATSLDPLHRRAEQLQGDMAALNERVQATRRTFSQLGADPGLFAVIDRELDKVLVRSRQFNENLEEITRNPDLLRGYEVAFQKASQTIFREIAGNIQPALRSITTAQRIEGNKANEVASRQQQERLQNARLANSRRIVAEQGANAQLLAETRIAGQQQIQQERITARRRIEILRFAAAQLKQIERGIAGAFRATGTILSTTVSGVGSGLSRITALFRRSDNSLNDGLRGALIRREQTIDRSFRRQTSDIRRETIQQSQTIQRFERQASTGIAGAVTGRSSLGSLFGGGLAIGGGFAAFQGLRNGLDVGGDFVQGLAVLGAQLELTEEQMQGVREQSIELGNDISLPGVSALDAAQAIQILAKQFANLGETALPAAQGAARGVLQLARAAGVDAEEAARVVGASVNVFGLAAEDAVIAADQITNALTKAAGVGFGDFADAFTQSAGVVNLFTGPASEATDTLAEFNAAIAVLAKSGLIGSDAGTSLKQFFLQANRGTAEAKKAMNLVLANAGEVGSVFFDAAGGARTLGESLDILRRGTKDLTNQELATTLNKLFGSDAARAAAFLIGTTTAEFEGLVTSIQTQGSAAEIAAAQNTGLRGALDALGSVIETQQIKTYERFQGVLGNVVLRFADLLNAFFEGRGRMGLLRDALTGVAVALGGLLVAKAVGEAFGFMAVGLRAVATPLGLVVGGLTALGAAIAILRRISPDFREETNRIADAVGNRLGEGLEFAADGLARLSRFMRTEVVPRFVEFGVAVADRVLPAVDRFADLIQRAAVPAINTLREVWSLLMRGDFTGVGPWEEDSQVVTALLRFRGFVLDTVGAVEQIWNIFIHRRFTGGLGPWGPHSDTIKALYTFRDTVASIIGELRGVFGNIFDNLPTITPAKILSTLGVAALGTLIGGPLGAAIGAAIGFAVGGLNLRAMGDDLINALRPPLQRARDFVGDFFSGRGGTFAGGISRGLQGFLLGPFQEAASTLGFFVGNLATDPRLIAGLEKLVGLAVLTGVNFVKGLGKGIGDNLPELGELFGKQLLGALKLGLSKAFDPRAIAKFVVSGLGAAAIGVALFRSLSRPTTEAGRKVGQGFIRSLGSTLRTGFTGARANPFAAGLFGNAEAQAAKAGERTGERFISESRRAAQRLGALNVPLNIGFDDRQFRSASEQLAALQRSVGPALAGMELRASAAGVLDGLRQVRIGVSEVIDGIRFDFEDKGGQTIRSGFSKMTTSFRTGIAALAANIKATGIGVGQAIGGAILSGVGAALAGQQLGTADSRFGQGIGLAGIIASALFAGASVGGGPQGVAVGGFVAALGLVSAAIAKTGEDAKEAEARVQDYLDVLRGTDTAQDRQKQLQAAIEGVLRTADTGALGLLGESGFDIRRFTDDALEGALNSQSAFEAIALGLGVSADAIRQFRTEASKAGTSDITGLLSDLKGDPGEQFRRSLENTGVKVDDFISLIELLGGEQESLFAAAQRFGALELIDVNAGQVEAAARAERARADAIDASVSALGRLNVAEDDIARRRAEARPDIQAQIVGDINTAIESLNEQRLDAISTQISELTGQLDSAKLAAETALTAVLDLVQNPLADPFTQAFDQLLLSVASVGQGLQEELSKGIDIGAAFGDLESAQGALVRQVVDPFSNAFSAAVAQAITDNPGISAEDLRAKFQPIFDEIASGKIEVQVEVPEFDEAGTQIGVTTEMREVNLPPEAQQLLIDRLNTLLANPSLEMGLENVLITDTALADAQRQLEEANLALGLRVQFSPAQIAEELRRLGLGVSLGSVLGFLEAQAVAEDVARARALADQTPQERREQPLPPPVVFNQTVNQTISGGGMPVETASQSAAAMRTAVVVGVIPRLNSATAIRS